MSADNDFRDGLRHLEAGKLDSAERAFRKSIASAPNFAPAHYNLGFVLHRRGRARQAIHAFQRAAEIDPAYAQAHIGLAFVFERLGEYEAAENALRQAVAAAPHASEPYRRLGDLLRDLGRIDEATIAYDQALTLNPLDSDARFGRGLAALTAGDLPQGWRDYQSRKSLLRMSREPGLMPHWQGEDPAGKTLLLYGEQGLGDTIQFLRYGSLLAERGAKVLLAVPPNLAELAVSVRGVSDIVPPSQPLPRFDWSCPLATLPLHFGTTLETIPAKTPYVSVSADRERLWRNRLGKTPNLTVALAWSGNPSHPNDRHRSLPFAELAPLLRLEAVRFVVLQKDLPESLSRHASDKLILLGPELTNFADIGAVMLAADLVISVDTAFCHLAGALGCPVWTLLSFVSDWRWLKDRADSPWYPTMRLYRQPKIGDWRSVIIAVREELQRMTAKQANRT